MRQVFPFVVAAALAVGACGSTGRITSPGGASPSTPTLVSGTFTLHGRITEAGGNSPLGGAHVELFDGEQRRSTDTDEAGTFSFDGQAIRDGLLSISKFGFQPESLQLDLNGDVTLDLKLDRQVNPHDPDAPGHDKHVP
jgi:hypothetical protein